jgi:hypothetical protein
MDGGVQRKQGCSVPSFSYNEDMTGTRNYFAYGANMNQGVFTERRGINPNFTAPAKITGWQLAMEHPGVPFVEPVFATIKEQDHAEVHGVLYEIKDCDFDRLNNSEGAAYQLVWVNNIECEGRMFRGCTFVSPESCAGKKPSRRYMKLLIQGAKENDLPERYIAELENIEAIHLPIISWLVDFLAKIALKYTASGRRLNLLIVKFGASSSESD